MKDVEENYELPAGWEWITLGSIVIDVEKVNPKIDFPSHEFVYLDISSIDNKNQKIVNYKNYLGEDAPSRARQLVKSDDILFSTVRTYLKNIAIVDNIFDNQIGSTGFCVIRPHEPIEKKLIFYLVQTDDFLKPLNRIQRGVSYPAVRDSDVFAQLVPLPPLLEQRRIVAKIEELFTQLDAGVSALEKTQAQLRRYRQSVLKAAVEGKLTEEWRRDHPDVEPASVLLYRILKERRAKWETDLRTQNKEPRSYRYKDPVLPIPSDVPKLQNTWTWTSYDSLTTFVTSGSRAWKKYLGKGSGIFILLQNLKDRQLDLDQPTFVDAPSGAEAERTRVQDGDILISIVGKTGTTCLVRGIKEAYVSQSVALTRPSHLINGRYLEYYFSSEEWGQRFFNDKAYGMGRAHLLLSHIKETPVVLPPLAEQHEIISEIERRLSVADQIETTLEANLRRAARLRHSILKKAFRGALVPQDPNDKPASELIRRIKGEKDKNKQKEHPIKRERKGDVSMDKTRRSLYDVLVEAKIRLTPEELFSRSEFTIETIDEFYQELRSEVDIANPRIDQIRPNNKDAYLKVSGYEDTQP